ncbi:hypothetical protein TNCV_3887331 [Trichonephila clavipes]|nr:hypothetical protein TNCV_3887331 [Trichonephila clavipes]
MSSRHHIDDFYAFGVERKIRRRAKITDRCARGVRHRSALFHGCGSHLKLLKCVVDGTGRGRVRRKRISRKTVARRLKGGRLYALHTCCVSHCQTAPRTARLQWCREHLELNRTGHAYYSQMSRFSLSSDCRRQLIWRESGTAYRPENIRERTDIRHAVSWCGPES